MYSYVPKILLLLGASVFSAAVWWSASGAPGRRFDPAGIIFTPPDTTDEEEEEEKTRFQKPYKPTTEPTFELKDRRNDIYTEDGAKSPLLLKEPGAIKSDIELDDRNGNYRIEEKIGEMDNKPPSEMSFEEFQDYRNREMSKKYWREASGASEADSPVKSKGLIPTIYMSPLLDRIFGGNTIEIVPNGQILLDFGGRWQRTSNPAIPIRQQRIGGFNFDQQIAFNFNGKVGERLRITANWDTKATFDFDNNIKIEYKALPEDIIQSVEAGNVSMVTGSSLIQGAQNLFGIKTKLRFGRLYVTALVANQRGKADEVVLQGGGVGGAQTQKMEFKADNYEENRHFFLGHYFRDTYEGSLSSLPIVSSGYTINRVELYVTNRNNTTTGLRNMVGMADLGETDPHNKLFRTSGETLPSNNTNDLYRRINNPTIRNSDQTSNQLQALGLRSGEDFEIIRGARKLEENRDFRINKNLGYITLNTPLRNDDVLAVAYQYTDNKTGRTFKVGELSEDYSSLPENQTIILKLLRNSTIRTDLPLWDLQMKNIYSLNVNQIARQNFNLKIIYRDDFSGVDNPSLHVGVNLKNKPLVQVMNADRLGPNGDPQPDGSFDYVPGVTVDSLYGRIMFPVLEPFGSHLRSQFTPDEATIANNYVYDELYNRTKPDAQQITQKNKFYLIAQIQAGQSGEIRLPGAFNVAQGSVTVTAGSSVLTEGQDYTVDLTAGTVRINEAIMRSGQEIRVRFEKPDLFNFRSKSLVGTRLDYKVNQDVNIGATVMHLNERPLITRVSVGDEPLKNTMWGMDGSYRRESGFLTKMVDKIPLIDTKEKSTINFSGEFAQLIPGSSRALGDGGNSFIDDFETSETPFDFTRQAVRWKLGASPPQFYELPVTLDRPLTYTYKRARLAWYNIDNVFYTQGQNKPGNITEDDLKNHYVRVVEPQEIFPERNLQAAVANEITFDLAFFPEERGQYNFNPDLTPEGLLKNPRSNFGAITRPILFNTDFDDANIQYIEFWLMDPFADGPEGIVRDGRLNKNNTTGGKLLFHLGSVSEDIMKDGRHAFENGLPNSGISDQTLDNEWGRVTNQQFLTNAFDNTIPRGVQDVGLDGLNSAAEQAYFANNFLNLVPGSAREAVQGDPSADDFIHYLDGSNSAADKKIVERYKFFNGLEGNSPQASGGITLSSTQEPDNEDLNQNNTVSDQESFYEYEVDLRKGQLAEGRKYIVSESQGRGVKWYQFRIPIRSDFKKQGDIFGFKSIRFFRIATTDWQEPVVLRMAGFQLVSSQWRDFATYPDSSATLENPGLVEASDPKGVLTVSTVNVEENSQDAGNGIPYVLPPNSIRDRDNTSTLERRLNEQSMRLCVENLRNRDAKAVFKNVNFNFINYERLKMWIHAQKNAEKADPGDDRVTCFVRLGTDLTQNYYEVEIPLKITPPGTSDEGGIWRADNELDVAFEDLTSVKASRNAQSGFSFNKRFTQIINGRNITVAGNPDLTAVVAMMIGIRNPDDEDKAPKSVCVWVNEMRVQGFNKKPGFAALARADAKLADFATVTASGRYVGIGFGTIEQKVADRQRQRTIEYSLSSNVQLDKFVPKSVGLRLPMYVSYDRRRITPEFDPLNPDTKLSQSLEKFDTKEKKDQYRKFVEENETRRSINFANISKVKTGAAPKKHIYDVENFNFSLGYSDMYRTNINTQEHFNKTYQAGMGWSFAPKPVNVEPLKGIKGMKSKSLKPVKEFNFSPFPSNINFRADLMRSFTKTQLRNEQLTTEGVDPFFQKYFTLNRVYGLQWALTKSISIDYLANVNAVIDEPDGDLTPEGRRQVLDSLKKFGRIKNYNQNIGVNYQLPLNKFPLTDWISATYRYSAGSIWTAGALGIADTLGNTLQNNRQHSLNGKIDLGKLYNKSKYLAKVNNPPPKRKTPKAGDPKNAPKEVKKDPPKTLGTSEKENYSFGGEPDKSKEDKDKNAAPPELAVLKGVMRALMSAKNINFTYTLQQGTYVPGYMPGVKYLGMSEGFAAPYPGFLLGSQNKDEFQSKAAERNWISNSSALNDRFSQNFNENLNLRTAMEPFKDFKIQVDVNRIRSGNYSEFFGFNEGILAARGPQQTGSYTISFISIKTAMQKDDKLTNRNQAFKDFESNRFVIYNRLKQENRYFIQDSLYSKNSQDVLIPAFISAYTGRSPEKVEMNPFPKWPLPNWRVNYGGLSKLEFIKKRFSTVNLTHSYTSEYSVGNFSTTGAYGPAAIDYHLSAFNEYTYSSLLNETTREFIPVLQVSQVLIRESFAPLIGVNAKTKSNITLRLEYRYNRNVALEISNAQVTEQINKDIVTGIGYTKSNLSLPFKSRGRTVVLKNEIVFRLDATIRDSKTIQRKLDGLNTVTQGNINLQLKPNISYQVNQRLSTQFYFERTIMTPRVSNSFRRATTAFGIQLRFSLS